MDSQPDFDRDDVHAWLVGLEEGLPLDGQWQLHNTGDPVEELYRNVQVPKPQEFPIWIGVAMAITLVCVGLVVLAALGKTYSWEPAYGMDFDLWQMTKGALKFIYQRVCTRKVKMVDASDYVEAIDRFGVVHIYEAGKRISEITPALTTDMQINTSNGPDEIEYLDDTHGSPETRIRKVGTAEFPSLIDKTDSIFGNLVIKIGRKRKRKDKKKQENQSERFNAIRAFQSRPLPSVTEQLSPITKQSNLSDSHTSPFMKTNVFTPVSNLPGSRKNMFQMFGKLKRQNNFKQVEEILLGNSLDNRTAIAYNIEPSKRNISQHTLPEMMKHQTLPVGECTTLEHDVRSLRSQSMDDAYDMKTKRKNRKRDGRRNSLGDVTINEIYDDMKSVTEAPLGTYGTWEKDGYLQLPYNHHPRPLSSESKGADLPILKEEVVKRVCNFTDDTNLYDSIKSRTDDENLYDSIKGKGYVLNIPNDTNIYDSVKGIPIFAIRDDVHTYAKIPENEEITVDVRYYQTPRIHNTNETVIDSMSQTPNYEQGHSIHEYEKIEHIRIRGEKIEVRHSKNEKDTEDKPNPKDNVKREGAPAKSYKGVYMKFGEVVKTKF